jgi:hypothetical protein
LGKNLGQVFNSRCGQGGRYLTGGNLKLFELSF